MALNQASCIFISGFLYWK